MKSKGSEYTTVWLMSTDPWQKGNPQKAHIFFARIVLDAIIISTYIEQALPPGLQNG